MFTSGLGVFFEFSEHMGLRENILCGNVFRMSYLRRLYIGWGYNHRTTRGAGGSIRWYCKQKLFVIHIDGDEENAIATGYVQK